MIFKRFQDHSQDLLLKTNVQLFQEPLDQTYVLHSRVIIKCESSIIMDNLFNNPEILKTL